MNKPIGNNAQIIEDLQKQIKDLQHLNQINTEQFKKFDINPLTGLLIKEAFFRDVRKMLSSHPNEKFVFLRFDIDKFQTVNTLFGYEEGDRLLKYCANAIHLVKNIQDLSVAGHIDADIFCICSKSTQGDGADTLLNADIDSFLNSYRDDYRFNISIGQYYIQNNTESTRSIYSRATIASRKCKDTSDLYLYQYDIEMDKALLHNQLIASEMHNALENGEFVAFLQPKVDLKTKKLMGAEALVRWIHPKRGIIPPNDFIPIFEQNGFILKLDRHIFRQACIFIRGWIDAGIEPVPISINLSQFNFTDDNLTAELISILDQYKIEKHYIHLEITESAYSGDIKQTVQAAKELAEHGFHLEMDDFGTGISSLTMLNELPVKTLKLDLRFIQSKSREHNNGNILNFIVTLAKQMQMDLVAEGIETEDQLNFLKSIGCDYGQGYLFSKPVPKEEFDKMLTSWAILQTHQIEFDATSMLDMNDLWYPNSKFNLLFNALVGGSAIYEVSHETGDIKVIKINDEYFDVVNLERENYQYSNKDIRNLIFPEDLAVLQQRIMGSIKNDVPFTVEMRIIDRLDSKKIDWLKLGARIIVRTKEATLFLVNIENITVQKKHIDYLQRETQIHKDYKKQLSIYRGTDSSGIATMRIDNGMILVYANDCFLKIHECSRKYAFAHADSIMERMVYSEDRSTVEKALKSILAKKKNRFEWTMRICTHNKKVRTTLVSALIRYEDDGTYADIVVRDITDIQSLKERLKTTEDRLTQIVLDSSPTVWDVKTKICCWSKAMQMAFQLPPIMENFPEKYLINEYIRQDSMETLLNVFDQLMHKNKDTLEVDLWIKNQTLKYYICQKSTFVAERNETGEVVRINATGVDMVKKASEQKYRELNQILSNIPGYVIVISVATSTIRYANDAYYNLIGYSKEEMEELFGNTPKNLMHPDDFEDDNKQLHEDFVHKGELHMKGRFNRKDGKELWLRIDGKKIDDEIFCVVTDETDLKHTVLELEAEREFNKTLESLTNDMFFHFDLYTTTVRFSGSLAHEYMPDLIYKNFTQYVKAGNIGVKEDLKTFVTLIDAMYAGKEIASEFRFKNKNGQISCFRTDYRIVFDKKTPAYAIGKLTNIDREKDLLVKAETDSLTSLYNKGTTQLKIEQALNKSTYDTNNALFIIDIDNFKYANDTFGHQFGDMLLVELAFTMKNIFRDNDFVGRLGGDEFMIFMHGFTNEEAVKQKAHVLLSALRMIKVGDSRNLTVSIGISQFPKNGQTYKELYRTADIALYNSKSIGKNCFSFYQKDIDMNTLQVKTEIEHNIILEQGFDRNIVFKVFEMLQTSKNLSTTVNEVMSMMGNFFTVDRSYIFEKKILENGSVVYDNIHEWCKKGIKPVIDDLQGVPHETYASVWEQYDSKGIFMCSDITKLEKKARELLDSQGIKSVLQCIVRQNEEIKLMFGFDACFENREWKPEEALTLLYITQILGGHLLKKKD